MKVIKEFNNISEELKSRVKPFLPGDSAHYRLLNGTYDMVSGEIRHGSQVTIVCRDTVRDGNKIVEVGVPGDIKDNQVLTVKEFNIAPIGANTITNGVFTLRGDSIEHQQFYEFFEICNFNKSNINRDMSVVPRIERIDEVAEAEADIAELDVLTKALVLAGQMSAADMKSFAAGKNWPSKEQPALLRNRIKKYALEKPADFLQSHGDPNAVIKVTIKQALDANILVYLSHEHKIAWADDGKTLAILEKPENGESAIELFQSWLAASKNGENILKSLRNKLKALSKEGE